MSKKLNEQTPTKIKAMLNDVEWKELAKLNEAKTRAKKTQQIIKK